jgi:GNAT superfamily N-acetyltransferase
MTARLRAATADDVDTIVRILIASKEASFPDLIDNHDRDVRFWTRRWRGYLTTGSRAQQSLGDGFVFIAERDEAPVGYAAYHHTRRLGTDAELQNLYVLREWQAQGVGTELLGVIAHRLEKDGSKTMCVGFDANSPYTRFYTKHGAEIDGSWAIWRDIGALAGRLPRPDETLLDLSPPRPARRLEDQSASAE